MSLEAWTNAYKCETTGLYVRNGEAVDPARWAQAQMNVWVDKHILRNYHQQAWLDRELSWDYFKLGYVRETVTRDRRLKGWRNWED